jgi:hypothetical protein
MVNQKIEKWVVCRHAAAKQIEPEPAAMLALDAKRFQAEGLKESAAIFGMYQPRVGLNRANSAHRKHNPLHLMEKRANIAAHCAMVREPVAVQASETTSRLRLIDRRVVDNPWVALRHLQTKCGELLRKLRV